MAETATLRMNDLDITEKFIAGVAFVIGVLIPIVYKLLDVDLLGQKAIQNSLHELQETIGVNRDELRDVEHRQSELEKRVGVNFAELRGWMEARFVRLEERLKSLEGQR